MCKCLYNHISYRIIIKYYGVVMHKKIDLTLFVVSICLIIIGLLMVYSASNIVALYKYNDSLYFIKRQGLFAVIGFIIMYIVIRLDNKLFYKYVTLVFFVSLLLLILVIIPGVGMVRGGARSWLGIGSFSIQPAEFMKLAIIMFLAKYLSNNEKDLNKFWYFIFMLFIVGLIFGIIMLQPDFGTGIVLVISCCLLLFCCGAPIKYFVLLLSLGVGGIIVLIASAPYRMERILAYLDPWSDPLGSGFQTIQSLYAISPSGLFGLGYNNSMQKHFFLPEPQNDFIFAIICEELGLIGAVIVIGLFALLIYRIIYIATKLENKYHKYLCLGIGLIYFTQVFINIGVVIGLLPVTGITLPIISYGGSSLVLSMIMIAIVLNLSKGVE